jgi:hypothetical protein
MALVLPSASPLRGSTSKRRSLLTVTGPGGEVVVEARLRKRAEPSAAVFETAEGEYRLERPERFHLAVFDPSGAEVTRKQKEAVTLAGDEVLEWDESTFVRSRFRLGGDLWVAKPRWPPPLRGFTAELSTGFLAREDRGMLAGLAAVLTQWAIETEATMNQIGNPG